MRKGVVMASVLVSLLYWLVTPCGAVDVTEIGVQIHVMQDPFLSDGELRLGVALGGYCRLVVSDEWTVHIQLGSPLDLWLPGVALAAAYAVGDRWTIEAQMGVQSDLADSVYLTLNLGARVALGGSETSRLMLSSFPISLSGLHYFNSGDWSFSLAPAVNAFLDYTWAASDRVNIGQAIGLTLLHHGAAPRMAIPLGGEHGLVFDSITHLGLEP